MQSSAKLVIATLLLSACSNQDPPNPVVSPKADAPTAQTATDAACIEPDVIAMLGGHGAPTVVATLRLSECATSKPVVPLKPAAPPPLIATDAACSPPPIAIPLLGSPGDSPLVPVTVHNLPGAMFFSPGFVPLLFADNGPFLFPQRDGVSLLLQDASLALRSRRLGFSKQT